MQGRASVVEPDGAEPRPGQSFHRERRVSGGRIHGSQCRGGSRGARGQGSASVHPSRGSRLGTGSGGVMCGTPGTLARWTGSVRKVPQDPAGRRWWSTSLPRSSAEMVYIHPVLRDPRQPSELATVPVVLAAQAEQGRDAAASHRRVPGHQHSTRAGRRPTQPREAREAANRATAGRDRPPRSGARQAAPARRSQRRSSSRRRSRGRGRSCRPRACISVSRAGRGCRKGSGSERAVRRSGASRQAEARSTSRSAAPWVARLRACSAIVRRRRARPGARGPRRRGLRVSSRSDRRTAAPASARTRAVAVCSSSRAPGKGTGITNYRSECAAPSGVRGDPARD